MKQTEKDFLKLAIDLEALRFGDFTLKSGMKSSYFFNISAFFNSETFHKLISFYYQEIIDSGLDYQVLFGPAYKGIPLASGLSSLIGETEGKSAPFAFDRKEVKDHGEGGSLVGDVKDKKVLIIDDVLTAGTALKNSIDIINGIGGQVIGAIVALDREEVFNKVSAKDSLEKEMSIPILSIAKISNLIGFLKQNEEFSKYIKYFNQ